MAKTTKVVWEGPDDLRDKLVPIDEVDYDPSNARAHGDKNRRAIRASLLRFGQQKPIVVAPSGVVTAGNGTLAEARGLGWTHIAAIRSDLPPTELAAFGITDNRTAELAEWDRDALASMLGGLQQDGVDLPELGWDDADLARLLHGGDDFDPEEAWDGMPEYESKDLKGAFRVNIQFATEEHADEFFRLIERPRKAYMWWPHDDGHVGSSLHEEYVVDEDGG